MKNYKKFEMNIIKIADIDSVLYASDFDATIDNDVSNGSGWIPFGS